MPSQAGFPAMEPEQLITSVNGAAEQYLLCSRNRVEGGRFPVSVLFIARQLESSLRNSFKHSIQARVSGSQHGVLSQMEMVELAAWHAANRWNATGRVVKEPGYLLGGEYFVDAVTTIMKPRLTTCTPTNRPEAVLLALGQHKADNRARAATNLHKLKAGRRIACLFPNCQVKWAANRPDAGIDHLARSHDYYYPGDKNTMSVSPGHLRRKAKHLLVARLLMDRRRLNKLKSRLRRAEEKLSDSEIGGPKYRREHDLPCDEPEEVLDKGELGSLDKEKLVEMLIADRRQILKEGWERTLSEVEERVRMLQGRDNMYLLRGK